MSKVVYALLLLAALAATPGAAAVRCDYSHGSVICEEGSRLPPGAAIIDVPLDLSAEAQERARKWEAFCKPKPVYDEYGVARLKYRHAGCEFGRYE